MASLATAATTSSGVGSYPITVAPGTLSAKNYDFSNLVNGTLTVVKATPTITWANPADITAGTPLGASQLAATASVAGVFTYSPVNGTLLGAGAGQTLAVTFTPSDTTHYNPATATVTINVNPGTVVTTTPTITWANPADITAGTPLGASQLAATASVAGVFTYTPAEGTVLSAGAGQTLAVRAIHAVGYNELQPDDGHGHNQRQPGDRRRRRRRSPGPIPPNITAGTPLGRRTRREPRPSRASLPTSPRKAKTPC